MLGVIQKLYWLAISEEINIKAVSELTIACVTSHFGEDVMFYKPSHKLVGGCKADIGLFCQIVDGDNGVGEELFQDFDAICSGSPKIFCDDTSMFFTETNNSSSGLGCLL